MGNQLFACHSIEELGAQRASVLNAVNSAGYAVLRGLFDDTKTEEARKAVYRYANSTHHCPSFGGTGINVRRNTSKWSIGSRSSQDGVPRFAVVVYNPMFDSDSFRLHEAFDRIIRVRDKIAGRDPLWDSELMPDRFNACRVQIYPAGGGFLGAHRDLRGESNLPTGMYVEVLLLLTERGTDYHTGGGIVAFKGTTLDSETGTKRADVVIYNAATIHGVQDVDPEVPFDPRDLRGRAVAMATIYDNR